MKTIAHITLILFFISTNYYLCAQTEPVEKNFQDISNTLTVNQQQSTYELTGFEGRAVQKVEELAEYIEIISDKDYDSIFRKRAFSMAVKLFKDQDIKISNSDKLLSSLSILGLNNYLNAVMENGYAKIVVEISNREYVENLSQSKSDAYSGKLLFDQTNYYYKNKNLQKKNTEKKEVDIILVKTEKKFGKKTKSVWNVYLGDIRLVKK